MDLFEVERAQKLINCLSVVHLLSIYVGFVPPRFGQKSSDFCVKEINETPSISAQKRRLFDIVFNVQHDFITYNNHKIMFYRYL